MKNLVGAEVRKRRKALKITLEELAHNVGTDSGNLSRAERGVQGMSDDLLRGLARELGCTVADFYSSESVVSTPVGVKRLALYSQNELEELQEGQLNEPAKTLLTDLNLNANSYAVDVSDDAIESEIKSGDRIIVDGELKPVPGDFVVVRSHRIKKTYVRKYRALGFSPTTGDLIFEAKPTNPDHPSMNSESDLLQVLGVVVEHRRIRKKT